MTPKEQPRGWWSRTWKVIAGLATVVGLLVGVKALIGPSPHHPPAFAYDLSSRAGAAKFLRFLANHTHKVVTLNISCPTLGGPVMGQGACQAHPDNSIDVVPHPGNPPAVIVTFRRNGSNASFTRDLYSTLSIGGNFYISSPNTPAFDTTEYDLTGQNSP